MAMTSQEPARLSDLTHSMAGSELKLSSMPRSTRSGRSPRAHASNGRGERTTRTGQRASSATRSDVPPMRNSGVSPCPCDATTSR